MSEYTKPDHHEDAYKLVTYETRTGVYGTGARIRHRVWNATPKGLPQGLLHFAIDCYEYQRVEYQRDEYAPNHAMHLRVGDVVFTGVAFVRADEDYIARLSKDRDLLAIAWDAQCRRAAEAAAAVLAERKEREAAKVVPLENRAQRRAREARERARPAPVDETTFRRLQRIICYCAAATEEGEIRIDLDNLNGPLPDVQFETVDEPDGRRMLVIKSL